MASKSYSHNGQISLNAVSVHNMIRLQQTVTLLVGNAKEIATTYNVLCCFHFHYFNFNMFKCSRNVSILGPVYSLFPSFSPRQFLDHVSQVFIQTLSSRQSPILLFKIPGVLLGFIYRQNFITFQLFICLMVCLLHLSPGHWVSCSLWTCLRKLEALRMLSRHIDAVSVAGEDDIVSRGFGLGVTLGTPERRFPCVITLL